jgi:hypothetical protein
MASRRGRAARGPAKQAFGAIDRATTIFGLIESSPYGPGASRCLLPVSRAISSFHQNKVMEEILGDDQKLSAGIPDIDGVFF